MSNTSYYKPTGRRGGFRQGTLGDSTRQIERQARTIIDSLKENQLRYQQVGSELTQGLKATHSNQAENSQILRDLDNKKWQTREDAMSKRGLREKEALQSLATEYGKKAEYWGQFTKTGALNLAKASTTILEELDRRRGEKILEEVEQSPEYEWNSNVLESASDEVNREITVDAKFANKDGEYKLANILLDKKESNNIHYNNVMADRIIAMKTHERALEQKFTEEANNPDPKKRLRYNSKTAETLFVEGAREIIRAYGLNPNSKGSRKIIDHFRSVGQKQAAKFQGYEQIAEDEDRLNKLSNKIKFNTDQTKEAEYYEDFITAYKNSWAVTKTGEFILPSDKLNFRTDGFLEGTKSLIDNGVFDQGPAGAGKQKLLRYLEHKPWDKDGDGKVSQSELWDKQDHAEEILQHWYSNNTETKRKELLKKDATTNQKITAIKAAIDPENVDRIDLSTLKGEEAFFDKFVRAETNEDVLSYAYEILSYSKAKQGDWDIRQNLKKAHQQGDLAEFLFQYIRLPDTVRSSYSNMFADIKDLTAAFGPGNEAKKDIKDWAETSMKRLVTEIGQTQTTKLSASAEREIEKIQHSFFYHFAALNKIEDPLERVAKAKELAIEPYQQNTGVGKHYKPNDSYKNPEGREQRYNINGLVEFAGSYEYETDEQVYTTEDLLDILVSEDEYVNRRAFMQDQENIPKENLNRISALIGDKRFISDKQLSNIVGYVHRGTDFGSEPGEWSYPKNLILLSQLTNGRHTPRQLLNQALKDRGFTDKTNFIPVDHTDLLQLREKEIGTNFKKGINPRHYKNLTAYLYSLQRGPN